MPARKQASEMLGQFINGRFIPRMAGGETPPPPNDDPPGGDPPKGKDGTPFDAARAQATIEAQRAEVDAAVKASKAAAAELAKAQARLKEIDDASKSETEKLAAKATEASEKLTAAEARAQDLAIRLSVERMAGKLSFIDVDDAYQLLDRKAIELDAAGDPTNVETLLKALVKAKPHLVKAEGDDAPKPGTRGVPPTPKPNGKPTPEDDLKLREASAAHWRSRF